MTKRKFDLFDVYFNEFNKQLFNSSTFDDVRVSRVKTDIVDDKLKHEIDLPGLRHDDVSVKVEGNVLYVDGKRDNRKFHQKLLIDDEYDVDSLEATMDAGVLTITLKKLEKKDAKQFVVKQLK